MPIQNRLKVIWAEKEIRDGKKLSYKQVSEDTGIPISVLTRYVSQKTRRYDIETLEKLCEYFECSPGDLIIYTPETKKRTK